VVASLIGRAKQLVRPIVHRRLHRTEVRPRYAIHGSDYGGWPVIDGSLDSHAVVYSFGVGEDVSFDLALIERFGVTVHAFDPTPRCMEWLGRQTLPARFCFHDYGIAAQDGMVEFFPPVNPQHVSYSLQPTIDRGSAPVIRPVHRLATIMSMLGHMELQLLKMDIEGFEYPVIDNLLQSSVLPQQLLIEFHHGMYGFRNVHTESSVARLRSAGYRIFYVSAVGREYGFVRS
jgi:FkbM family methyltransferase